MVTEEMNTFQRDRQYGMVRADPVFPATGSEKRRLEWIHGQKRNRPNILPLLKFLFRFILLTTHCTS